MQDDHELCATCTSILAGAECGRVLFESACLAKVLRMSSLAGGGNLQQVEYKKLPLLLCFDIPPNLFLSFQRLFDWIRSRYVWVYLVREHTDTPGLEYARRHS